MQNTHARVRHIYSALGFTPRYRDNSIGRGHLEQHKYPPAPIRAYLWHGGLGNKRLFDQMECCVTCTRKRPLTLGAPRNRHDQDEYKIVPFPGARCCANARTLVAARHRVAHSLRNEESLKTSRRTAGFRTYWHGHVSLSRSGLEGTDPHAPADSDLFSTALSAIVFL